MKVKRFVAESMQAALRQVREELGAEAVILSNKRTEAGLEVVAALDYEESKAKEAVNQMLARESEPTEGLVARLHAQRQQKLQREQKEHKDQQEQARRKIDAVRTERASQGAALQEAQATARPKKTSFNGIETLLNPAMKARLQSHLAQQAADDRQKNVAQTSSKSTVPPQKAAVTTATRSESPIASMRVQERPTRIQERSVEAKGFDDEIKVAERSAPEPVLRNPVSVPTSLRSQTSTVRPMPTPRQDLTRPTAATGARKRNEWDVLSDMQEELRSLKDMIKSSQGVRRDETVPDERRPQVMQALSKRLISMGLIPSVREALLKAAQGSEDFDRAWSLASTKLECLIRLEAGELIDKPGVVALLGPTGSGKTMTIGKMAARYVMKYGADSIALVTMDRYRIAAHEQLKVFGRILNIPVYTVGDGNRLDTLLDKLASKRLVLVDTAGLQHNDSGWSDQVQELKNSRHKIKPYLVLSAVGQYQVMCAQYHHYRLLALEGVILTKLDEAVSLGELVSFLAASKLPAAYLTDGQRVPADLHRVDKKVLIARTADLLNSSERWVNIHGEIEREEPVLHVRVDDEPQEARVQADKFMFHSA